MAALHPGDVRLLGDVNEIDDRGLELAEAICHRERQREERDFDAADADVLRAITAVGMVRRLTKRAT